jgi:hypothetical protein
MRAKLFEKLMMLTTSPKALAALRKANAAAARADGLVIPFFPTAWLQMRTERLQPSECDFGHVL